MVAGKNVKLLEFGLRRAQGPDGGLSASKYSYIGEWNLCVLLLYRRIHTIIWEPFDLLIKTIRKYEEQTTV